MTFRARQCVCGAWACVVVNRGVVGVTSTGEELSTEAWWCLPCWARICRDTHS